MIVEYFNKQNKNSAFLSVRFGNVFNSSGSVIQIFKEQIENGEDLTLTDPNVDRFFMSIDEAVKLVIKASQMGRGGEVFVLDMGTPIKIIDNDRNITIFSDNITYLKNNERIITSGNSKAINNQGITITSKTFDYRKNENILSRF